MDDDFVDVFPSAGGVGDSPVRTATQEHLGAGSPWARPSISLSIPGLDTGGAAAAVSPAIPGSRGVATPSPAKEAELRSARAASRDEDVVESPAPSPFPGRIGMALTIDPGGECVPTELEKKRAKLEKFRYECSEVSGSFMFVSGEDAAKQQGLVGSKGITHIINCAGPQCPNYLEYTGRFKFLRLNFYDHRTEDVAWFIYNAFDFIKTAQAQRGKILVHCVQGVSRSCTLAIAWLMLTTGIDYDEAYLRVRQGRPICAPNTGFICSLLEWQRRRQQPPSSPLLYRTAWHSSLFPNDLVLKICLHEDDRKHVLPTLGALDPRGCFLVVAPRGSPPAVPAPAPASASAPTSSTSRRAPEVESNGTWRTPLLTPLHAMPSTPSSAAARAAAAAAAAVVANAKASAAVAAAKEAQAVAAAAAADEALLVAKAAHASVAVPWTWRESEVGVRDRDGMRVLRRTPEGVLNRRAQQQQQQEESARRGSEGSSSGSSTRRTPEGGGGRRTPEGGTARRTPDGAGRWTLDEKSVRRSPESLPPVLEGMRVAEETKAAVVDVFVWKGSQSNAQMLELARQGAVWLREYEGWGAGASAPVVEEGQEPREMLRHLEHQVSDAREPPVYGDLSAPSPPPTSLRSSAGSSTFMPCATPSTHGGGPRAPMLSPSETPTLSPAGPSPSPGGVNFSPYGCGVSPAGALFPYPTISPAGSTAVSPTTVHRLGAESSASRRCSMTSAAEMDEEEEDRSCLIMGLSTMGEEQPEPILGPPPGRGGGGSLGGRGAGSSVGGGVGEGERGGGDPLPTLFELADELGGQGASGLRWSQLAVYDDQDLVPQCCFLLVPPGEQNFLWVGKAFAESHASLENLPLLQSLAREVAVRDARRLSDRILPRVSDVETAVIIVGDGNEPPEWWSSFERGCA